MSIDPINLFRGRTQSLECLRDGTPLTSPLRLNESGEAVVRKQNLLESPVGTLVLTPILTALMLSALILGSHKAGVIATQTVPYLAAAGLFLVVSLSALSHWFHTQRLGVREAEGGILVIIRSDGEDLLQTRSESIPLSGSALAIIQAKTRPKGFTSGSSTPYRYGHAFIVHAERLHHIGTWYRHASAHTRTFGAFARKHHLPFHTCEIHEAERLEEHEIGRIHLTDAFS